MQLRRAFDMILRRNAGRCSLKTLAFFTVDLRTGVVPDPRTLRKFEVAGAACVVADARAYYESCEALVQRKHPDEWAHN
jgi:hypothetical protein